jgi:hypothetical protein
MKVDRMAGTCDKHEEIRNVQKIYLDNLKFLVTWET